MLNGMHFYVLEYTSLLPESQDPQRPFECNNLLEKTLSGKSESNEGISPLELRTKFVSSLLIPVTSNVIGSVIAALNCVDHN